MARFNLCNCSNSFTLDFSGRFNSYMSFDEKRRGQL
ncbi:hypothetical protein Golob_005635, partial [Gossypium lobatum]|nr:hypothetical protein [Gossypium lobatum]